MAQEICSSAKKISGYYLPVQVIVKVEVDEPAEKYRKALHGAQPKNERDRAPHHRPRTFT
ncbi:MAG: hypothetical protein WD688_25275 [Candidatus Binatia bacterium]